MSSIAPPQHNTGHASDDWITPKWIIELLGPFDLDPCASRTQPWPCAKVQLVSNGLLTDFWNDPGQPRSFVWCNPPYGRSTSEWLQAMAQHRNGIALVFARTETKMFFRHVWPFASCMMFIRGRLTFHRPDGSVHIANSGGPSVLIGYGKEALKRLKRVGDEVGAFVELP